MAIHIHNDDLPETIDLGASIAIDTETMGLNPHRDRLCLVQLSAGDGDAHLVKIAHPRADALHLKAFWVTLRGPNYFILPGLMLPFSNIISGQSPATFIAPKSPQNWPAPTPTGTV